MFPKFINGLNPQKLNWCQIPWNQPKANTKRGAEEEENFQLTPSSMLLCISYLHINAVHLPKVLHHKSNENIINHVLQAYKN